MTRTDVRRAVAVGLAVTLLAMALAVPALAEGVESGRSGTDTAAPWRGAAAEAPESRSVDSAPVTVEDRAVAYRGSGTFEPGATELFEGLLPEVPGDTRQGTVVLTNESGSVATFYLRCCPLSDDERGQELLGHLSLSVVVDGQVLYAGTVADAEGLAGSEVCLGSVGAGGTLTVAVACGVDTETGNDLALSTSGVQLSLTAEDAEAPAARADSTLPRTGDPYQLGFLAALSAAGLVAASAAVVVARGEVHEEKGGRPWRMS